MILHFQALEADNNAIENLEGVYQLPKLEEVLLKNNSILKSENMLLHVCHSCCKVYITCTEYKTPPLRRAGG